MTSKPPHGNIMDIKSSTGRSSIVVFFFSLFSAKSYSQSSAVCVVPLAGIISCRLAFASRSHVAGWVWERALWRDYTRQGIEGLGGIWQLSSHINSSPPPPLFNFFLLVAYLFIWEFLVGRGHVPCVFDCDCGCLWSGRDGGGSEGFADVKMGQFRLACLWLAGGDPGLCQHRSTLWMLWRSRWTAERCSHSALLQTPTWTVAADWRPWMERSDSY